MNEENRDLLLSGPGFWLWEDWNSYKIVLEDNYRDPNHDFNLYFNEVEHDGEKHFAFYCWIGGRKATIAELHQERLPSELSRRLKKLEAKT